MSHWADLYVPWTNEIHEMPINRDAPCIVKDGELHIATFGHVPFPQCHCKPTVRFSEDGEFVLVEHRDVERGGSADEGKDQLQ